MLDKMKLIGIEPGKPFDTAKLDPAVGAERSTRASRPRSRRCRTAAKGLAGADIRNGWRIDRALGRWGNDYGRRAVAAWNGIGLNAPEDAIFMSTDLDGSGKKLDGANRYVLHFDANQLPAHRGLLVAFAVRRQAALRRQSGEPLQPRQHRPPARECGRLARHRRSRTRIRARCATGCPRPRGRSTSCCASTGRSRTLIDGRWNPPGDCGRRRPDALARSPRVAGRPAHDVLPALHDRGHSARLHRHRDRHADAPPGPGTRWRSARSSDRSTCRGRSSGSWGRSSTRSRRSASAAGALWILATQVGMMATLMVAMPIDYVAQIGLFTAIIFVHNAFGATQDVAIDALAVNVLPEHERGVGQRLHVRRRVDRTGDRRLGRAVPHRGHAVQLDLRLRRGRDPARHDLHRAAAEGARRAAAAAHRQGRARRRRRRPRAASSARRGARSPARAPRSSA